MPSRAGVLWVPDGTGTEMTRARFRKAKVYEQGVTPKGERVRRILSSVAEVNYEDWADNSWRTILLQWVNEGNDIWSIRDYRFHIGLVEYVRRKNDLQEFVLASASWTSVRAEGSRAEVVSGSGTGYSSSNSWTAST